MTFVQNFRPQPLGYKQILCPKIGLFNKLVYICRYIFINLWVKGGKNQ